MDVKRKLSEGGIFASAEFLDHLDDQRQRVAAILGHQHLGAFDTEPAKTRHGPWSTHVPTEFAQNLTWTFVLHLAYGALLLSRGFKPSATAGISQGELPAAFYAGSLTLEEAARCISNIADSVARGSSLRQIARIRGDDLRIIDFAGIAETCHVFFNVNKNMCLVDFEPEDKHSLLAWASGVRLSVEISPNLVFHHVKSIPETFLSDRPSIPFGTKGRGRTRYFSCALGMEIPTPFELHDDYWHAFFWWPVEYFSAVSQMRSAGIDSFLHIGHLSRTEHERDEVSELVARSRVF